MAIDAACIESLLARIRNDNAKGEYYLTDIVGLARKDGRIAALSQPMKTSLWGSTAARISRAPKNCGKRRVGGERWMKVRPYRSRYGLFFARYDFEALM